MNCKFRQFESTVRTFLGDPGTPVRTYAKDYSAAYQSIKKDYPNDTVTWPSLVPVEEQTEEGRPD